MTKKKRNCADRARAQIMRRAPNPATAVAVKMLALLSVIMSAFRPLFSPVAVKPSPGAHRAMVERNRPQDRVAGRYARIPSWEVIVKDLQRPGAAAAATEMLPHWVPEEAREWVDLKIREGDFYALRMLWQPKPSLSEFQDRIVAAASAGQKDVSFRPKGPRRGVRQHSNRRKGPKF